MFEGLSVDEAKKIIADVTNEIVLDLKVNFVCILDYGSLILSFLRLI